VGETFNGFKDKLSSIYISPTVIKMDSTGNVLWGVEAKTNAATFVEGGITVRNSGEVLLHGKFPGLLQWQGYNDSFSLPFNSGYRPFITRFNTTTGKVLGIDQLPASGCEEYATVSDGRDNVYIGGNFYTTLTVAGNTLAKVGGESDWYLAKYGHSNCNCTNIPEPQFSMAKTGQTANFTYTGSSGISTYRWDFGDGDTSTVANPTHNYKDSGSYIVCLKVTNSCGDNTYCRQVYLFPNSIANVLSAGDISIYPNPVNNMLTLDGLQAGASVVIYDLYGRKIIQLTATNKTEQIAAADWLPGTYLVQITDSNGNRYNQKVIKE
ncbi:MAG: PKD domain-containing protein, partial [Flavipsychrobacter sp.]